MQEKRESGPVHLLRLIVAASGTGKCHLAVAFCLGLLTLAAPLGTACCEERETPLAGEAAAVEVFGEVETDRFCTGATLYTNRPYTVKETPEYLDGLPFARSSIDRIGFRCTRPGLVTLLTPDPGHPRACSLCEQLEKAGFVRIAKPKVFQLFGDAPYDLVRVYQKELAKDDAYRLAKWAVLIGPQEITRWRPPPPPPPKPWPENRGELLYNGIRLPKAWPPRHLDPASNDPMPVPYLEFPPEVIPIDVGRQLFVDDFFIKSTDLERRYHKARKYDGNPVLRPETELELNGDRNAIACPKSGGIWWDPELQLFRMWYEAGWIHTICYATSRDGLHWDRPELDLQPGTNRIFDPAITPDSWAVFPDYDGGDPAARWKMYLRPPGGHQPGLSMVSADGVHWSEPVESGLTGDRSTMFYNPFRKKWVYRLRSGVRGRSRHYWECDDFLAGAKWNDFSTTWGDDTPVFWAAADRLDPPDPDVGQPAQPYNLDAVGYESLMLGIYQIHLGPPNNECMKQGLPKTTELNLAYSRDGFHWHRPDREPFIPASRRDVWDRGYVQSVDGLCLVRGDRLWFFYIGFQGDPNRRSDHWFHNGMYDRGATGVAFLRRDGFASMDAGRKSGMLTTRPLRFTGSKLFVNVDASQGELRAEMLDDSGEPIEPFTLQNCVSVRVDSTIEPVTWSGGDLSTLKDRPVRIRFTLQNGSLYSFWVSRDESGRSDGYVAGGGPGFTGPADTIGRATLEAEQRLKLDRFHTQTK